MNQAEYDRAVVSNIIDVLGIETGERCEYLTTYEKFEAFLILLKFKYQSYFNCIWSYDYDSDGTSARLFYMPYPSYGRTGYIFRFNNKKPSLFSENDWLYPISREDKEEIIKELKRRIENENLGRNVQ